MYLYPWENRLFYLIYANNFSIHQESGSQTFFWDADILTESVSIYLVKGYQSIEYIEYHNTN